MAIWYAWVWSSTWSGMTKTHFWWHQTPLVEGLELIVDQDNVGDLFIGAIYLMAILAITSKYNTLPTSST